MFAKENTMASLAANPWREPCPATSAALLNAGQLAAVAALNRVVGSALGAGLGGPPSEAGRTW